MPGAFGAPIATCCSRPRRPTAAPTAATSRARSRPPQPYTVGPDDRELLRRRVRLRDQAVDPRPTRRGGLPGRGRARVDAARPRCSPASPTACSSRTVPATRPRSTGRDRQRARPARQRAGVRHLPRPPDHGPRARRADVQAAVRSPRRQPSGAPDRRPAGSRSRARTTTTRSTPTSLPDGQRR